MNKYFFALSLSLLTQLTYSQATYSINDVIQMVVSQSPVFKQAQTQRETSYWQYRSFRTNYNPQLRLSGSAPSYTNSITPIRQPDGTIVYIPINQTNPNLNFGLQQPIPWTGGQISVNTGYNYFNDQIQKKTQWNGQVMNIFLNQPVFSYNQLKWDKKTKPIVFEESKRQYAQQLEAISQEAASRFFDVLTAQVNEQIANFNLANNDTIHKIETGRYNIGTTSQDKLLQVELQLLRSRSDVASAKLDLQLKMLALRSYIGIKDGETFNLTMPEDVPPFVVSEEEAMNYAKRNRAEYIAFARRRLEAEAIVAQAKGQRYQTNITAQYGLNNLGASVSDLYVNPSKQQLFNVSFNVPIIDWGVRRANTQTAIATKKLNDFTIAQDEVNFEQEVLTQVRQFDLLRLQIEITKKSDEVAQERYMVAQNRYLIGKIDITNLNIALQEKDNAKRAYLLALKSFWTSYFNLRRLTLYDFATGQQLYQQSE
ncbi:MAG TPA: TolC family protein [Cyclobacteriaceae bacterium]|jgi:outer membrane protein TolC|nr:TolC family protein [Cyclobacteriaceae bacterium]